MKGAMGLLHVGPCDGTLSYLISFPPTGRLAHTCVDWRSPGWSQNSYRVVTPFECYGHSCISTTISLHLVDYVLNARNGLVGEQGGLTNLCQREHKTNKLSGDAFMGNEHMVQMLTDGFFRGRMHGHKHMVHMLTEGGRTAIPGKLSSDSCVNGRLPPRTEAPSNPNYS